MAEHDHEHDSGVITADKKELKRPSLYKVLLHNDDYTTMEFVIYVLKVIFGKTQTEAEDIMLKVHNEGIGECGIYTFEIAETKCDRVLREAKEEGHPLKCSIEKD